MSQKKPITDSGSFKFKSKFLHNTNNSGIINVKIAAPLKYLSNFWRILEMPLINYKLTLFSFGQKIVLFLKWIQ